MPRRPIGAELLLLRRLSLGYRLLPSLAIPFAVCMIFTATFWVANAFALSGAQVAERDLGSFEHAALFDIEPGDLSGTYTDEITRVLHGKGIDELSIGVISSDVRPDQLSPQAGSGPTRVIGFVEAARPEHEFPDSYSLTSGRWPRSPGEVVLTPTLRNDLPSNTFTAFGGLAGFKIVGMFSERYDTESTSILAAEGTWQRIPEQAAKAFAPEGTLRVMWSGAVSAEVVTSVTRAVLRLAPPPGGEHEIIERASVVRERDVSLSESQRLLFAYPLALLTAMTGVALVMANRRWMRAYARNWTEIGLPASGVHLVMFVLLGLWTTASATSGVAIGSALGWSIRSFALPHLLTQPLGPVQSLSPVVVAAFVMVGTCLAVFTAQTMGARRLAVRIVEAVPWGLARRVLSAVALVRGIQAAARPEILFDDLTGTGVLITTAFVLLAPDFLHLARLLLPQRRARTLTARRIIDSDRGGLALIALIVAASIAFPITMNSYNASVRRSNDAVFASEVRPNQLWVDGTSSNGRFRKTASAVADALPDTDPIELRLVDAFVYPNDDTPSENTAIEVVSNPQDLRGVLGDDPWVRDMEDFIASGGVAFLGTSARPIHGRDPNRTQTLNLRGKTFGPKSEGLTAPFAGVMLAETAHEVDLRTLPDATVFAHVDQSEIDAAIRAVREAGLDIRLLSFHTPPAHTKTSAQAYFALGGLLILAAFLLVGLMRAIGERMRERSAQFLAMGFRRSWSASVCALQLGLAVASGAIAGVLGSTVAIWIFVTTPERAMLLDIPTDFVIWTITMVAAISAIGVLSCVLRVRAQASADF